MFQSKMIPQNLLCGGKIMSSCIGSHQRQRHGKLPWFAGCHSMKFQAIIPLFSRRIIAFLTQFAGNFCMAGTSAFRKDDWTGIHNIFGNFAQIYAYNTEPVFRQSLECWSQSVQPVRKGLVAWQLGEPFQKVVFGIFVDRLLLKSPLADAPQINCYAPLSLNWGRKLLL